MSQVSATPLPSSFYREPSVGDLAIRTTDGVTFHVHKDVLAHSSSFFSTMLSLPQAPPEATPEPAAKKATVDVHEDSAAWEFLINLIYCPVWSPTFRDLDHVQVLLDATRKYEMLTVIASIEAALLASPMLKQNPLGCYAVACAFEMAKFARAAARESLNTPIHFEYVNELELISLKTYHHLSEYRKQCSAAVREAMDWTARPTAWVANTKEARELLTRLCNCHAGGDRGQARNYAEATGPSTRIVRTIAIQKTWATYLDDLARKLEDQPGPETARCSVLTGPVIKSMMGCRDCAQRCHEEVSTFTRLVSEEISKAVDEVELIL